MTCPGSVVLSEGMPEDESEYASEGTRAHAFAERWLLMHFAQRGSQPAASTPEEIEIKKHVRLYIDECVSLATVKGVKDIKVFVEKQVAVNREVHGTGDFIAWHPHTHTLYVRDLKYGAGVSVAVERNIQLRIYALAALLTMKLPASVVNIGIVQPRYEHPDGFIRSVDFEAAELLDLYADVLDAVGRVGLAESSQGSKDWESNYLKPSEKGCRWCRAAAKCPAIKKQAQALAKQVFAPGAAYDSLELARVLDFLPILEGWIKNTREFAYTEAEKGHEIPDYKLVEKQAIRKWKDGLPDLPYALAKHLGCKEDDLWKPKELIGIGDAVKLAPGKNAKERDAMLEPFVKRESSGHTLVHISDKREPVRIDAKAVFAGILE
jgi:hypothetical protein